MVNVTRNFQVTIPKKVRTELAIKVGDEVMFEHKGGEYALRKLGTMNVEEFVGVIKSKDKSKGTALQRKWRAEFNKRENKLGISA